MSRFAIKEALPVPIGKTFAPAPPDTFLLKVAMAKLGIVLCIVCDTL
jgi:hypothetical protein